MRDDHRSKQELVHEVAGLRKQVCDLKDAMFARRRVEDALRDAASLLRLLIDGAPLGLALFRRCGTLLAASRPFAEMLGYESGAELLRVGGVLGVFADLEEQSRLLTAAGDRPSHCRGLFRRKDGARVDLELLTQGPWASETVVLAIYPPVSDLAESSFPPSAPLTS